MEPAGDPGHNGGQAVVGGRRGRRVGQSNGRGQAPLLRGGRGPRLRGVGCNICRQDFNCLYRSPKESASL